MMQDECTKNTSSNNVARGAHILSALVLCSTAISTCNQVHRESAYSSSGCCSPWLSLPTTKWYTWVALVQHLPVDTRLTPSISVPFAGRQGCGEQDPLEPYGMLPITAVVSMLCDGIQMAICDILLNQTHTHRHVTVCYSHSWVFSPNCTLHTPISHVITVQEGGISYEF